MRVGPKLFLLLLLGCVLALTTIGCQTPDAENQASRPWNAPKSWETGLPGGMNQSR